MKKVILTPNPYRDKDFQTVRAALKVLGEAGIEGRICLPFDVDRTFALPRDLHFCRFEREIQSADAIICFGGDGTILYTAKAATRAGIPVLGINIGIIIMLSPIKPPYSTHTKDYSICSTSNMFSFQPRHSPKSTFFWA